MNLPNIPWTPAIDPNKRTAIPDDWTPIGRFEEMRSEALLLAKSYLDDASRSRSLGRLHAVYLDKAARCAQAARALTYVIDKRGRP